MNFRVFKSASEISAMFKHFLEFRTVWENSMKFLQFFWKSRTLWNCLRFQKFSGKLKISLKNLKLQGFFVDFQSFYKFINFLVTFVMIENMKIFRCFWSFISNFIMWRDVCKFSELWDYFLKILHTLESRRGIQCLSLASDWILSYSSFSLKWETVIKVALNINWSGNS